MLVLRTSNFQGACLQLTKAKVDYTIRWKILDRAQSYSNATKGCKLCTLEKFYIICKQELATLTKEQSLRALVGMQTNFYKKHLIIVISRELYIKTNELTLSSRS